MAAIIAPIPQVLPTAADLYVSSLPTLPYKLNQHPTHPLNIWAGLLPSDPGEAAGGGDGSVGRDAKIFFMLINPRRRAGSDRLIFWFNGGPGCSSFDGALMENGPFRMSSSKPGDLTLLDWGGWEEFSGVVFIDQPPGTGLSYTPTNGYLHELQQASAHLEHFIGNFLKVFPEWEGVDTYLAGESFAGQYIPYFADTLLNSKTLPNFPLRGIAIGNGWIDPREQYPAYVDFAYLHKLVKAGTPQATVLDKTLKFCQDELDKLTSFETMPINVDKCSDVMTTVTAPFYNEVDGKGTCMNIYDVRLMDEAPACGMNWPPELPDVYTYLRRPDVVKALHATEHKPGWTECNGAVYGALWNHKSPASIGLLPGILEKIPVLLFAGDQDLICNHVGIERLIERMEFNGGKGLQNATVKDWYINDETVGTWTTARNLTYAKVFESSHMVPYDLPNVAHDMMLRFMNVDFGSLIDGTPSWKSRIGDDARVTAVKAGTVSNGVPLPEGTTAAGTGSTKGEDWEAYYNAGSALSVLLFILIAVALFFFFRARRARRSLLAHGGSGGYGHSRSGSLPMTRRDLGRSDEEEREPLDRPWTPTRAGSSGNGHGSNHRSGDGPGARYSPRTFAAVRPGSPRMGKGKTVLDESDPEDEMAGGAIFDVGEDEDEEGEDERRNKSR